MTTGSDILASCMKDYFQSEQSVIDTWAKEIGRGYLTGGDYYNWCGIYAGHVLHRLGCQIPEKPEGAQQFLKIGKEVSSPIPGDIVVFKRGSEAWMGHVAFYIATESDGRIKAIGGNQGSRSNPKVCTQLHDPDRLLGYRRQASPGGVTLEIRKELGELHIALANISTKILSLP